LREDQNHHPYAMIPFGAGHRACIGQDLACLDLKLIIIRMMQRGIILKDTEENTGGYEDRLACHPKILAVRVSIDRH
jgi:cytochrome P450